MTAVPRPRAVVCGDAPGLRRPALLLLHRSGFDVAAALDHALDLTELVGSLPAGDKPDVIVVDAASCGLEGLRVLGSLRRVAPESVLVVCTPFRGIRRPAAAAGADEVVVDDDLRPLVDVLDRVRATAHATISCPCCVPLSTAAARDPARSSVPAPAVAPGLRAIRYSSRSTTTPPSEPGKGNRSLNPPGP